MKKNIIIGILLILCIILIFSARSKAQFAVNEKNRSEELSEKIQDLKNQANVQEQKALEAAEEATRKMAQLQQTKMDLQNCQEGK